MPWYLWSDESLDTLGRYCRDCGEFLPWEAYYAHKSTRNGRQSICIPCLKRGVQLCQRARKLADPPRACESCGASARLEVDHDHETHEVRNWLCHPCNMRARRAWVRQVRQNRRNPNPPAGKGR